MPNASELIKWETVDSSNVRRVAYDEKSQTVCVEFHNGGLYTYAGVDYDVYMGLVGSESVGKYLNNVIKMYPYVKFNSEDELLASFWNTTGQHQ